MKDREKEILDFIIEKERVSLKELLDKFQISKRTLYYDLKSINQQIQRHGEIQNIDHKFSYVGSSSEIGSIDKNAQEKFLDIEYRKNYILYEILNGSEITIDKLSLIMDLSRNTIVQTIDGIKKDLSMTGVGLVYDKGYKLLGSERKIRDIFIVLMQEDSGLLSDLSSEVLSFDKKNNLKLTDYSLANLTKFVRFINRRIEGNEILKEYDELEEAKALYFFPQVASLMIPEASENEQAYIAAYISSLSSLNSNVEEELIEEYVEKLVTRFEAKAAIILENKDEFKKNIKRHLLSSYYRIKFKFPITSVALNQIRSKHNLLYGIIKDIIENEKDFPLFKGIREEEIALIAAYIGGYIKGSRENGVRKNKVVLVCPNGLTVSKVLEIQLNKYVPTAEIIDTISLKELVNYDKPYDYIVSTVEIKNNNKVIAVHPLLTKPDIELLRNRLIDIKHSNEKFDFELIMQAIRRNAQITNEKRLKEELAYIIYSMEEQEEYQPMLKDLLNEKRINTVKAVEDWKAAIRLAAAPLIEDKSIEELYVKNMIESVEKFGPYIVLAEGFALPHASSKEGVNNLAMSLLIVEDGVDLLGEKVNAFMVLAAIDNTSHVRALADLSELLYNPENITTFKEGNKKLILDLINN